MTKGTSGREGRGGGMRSGMLSGGGAGRGMEEGGLERRLVWREGEGVR